MISGRIPSMLQGMTQQAPELRLPTQGELQLNAYPHPVYGLGKRNGTEHIARLGNSVGSPFTHWIVREGEAYVFYWDGITPVVCDLSGSKYPVIADPDSVAYLRSTDLRGDLRGLTLADTTLLLNRGKTVGMLTDLSHALTNTGIIWVKRGNYASDYTVKWGANQATHTTSPTDPDELKTNEIASELKILIDAAGSYTTALASQDSVITLVKTAGGSFTLESKDSGAGSLLGSCFHQSERFDTLPPLAPNGYVARVFGALEEETDDYFVKFDASRANAHGLKAVRGSWVECIAPLTAYRLDPATMPQALNRYQDDSLGSMTGLAYSIYFKLEPVEWADRTVGSTDSNKDPSFVGNNIDSLVLYRSRLGFLSQGKLILSRVNDFFNFFRTATMQVLPDDRIDIAVPTGKALDLHHAVPLSEELLLVGRSAQLVLAAPDGLTAETLRVNPATELEVDVRAVPTAVGGTVFLPIRNGDFSGLLEYYTGTDRIKTAVPASSAIPRLMEGSLQQIDSSSIEMLLAAQSARLDRIHVYKWLDSDRQRVQSAWGVWTFGDSVLGFKFIGSALYFVLDRDEGIYLERLVLEPNRVPAGASGQILLDRRVGVGPTETETVSVDPLASYGVAEESLSLVDIDIRTIGGSGGSSETGGGDTGGTGGSSPSTSGLDPTGSPTLPPSIGVSTVTIGEDAVVIKTRLLLPWMPTEDTQVVRGDGSLLAWTAVDGDPYSIELAGDQTRIRLYVGQKYTCRYRFSPAMLYKQTQGGGNAPISTGRLQVTRWSVQFSESGPFSFEVYRDGSLVRTKNIVQRRLFEPLNNAPRTGEAGVMVQRESSKARVDLVNPHHTQAWFTSAEWSGEYSREDSVV